jgi:diaminohydroxyphosphoribosylaminopyrimidine deaminase / 5-amino-6-(5-phosphoribosylamino)uracil reductase
VRDPNPSVSGRGFAILRKGRVRVETGLLAREAEFVNRAFFKRHRAGLPYVIWKTAQTLDGKTASRTGASRWITGPEARAMGHRLRGQSDAILVGGETVRRDDPGLTAHGQGPDPLILVLSRSLDIPTGARIFKSGAPVWIATGPNPPAQRAKALQKRGAEILKCSLKNSKVDLINLFKLLSKMNVNQILFEGGGATAWGLLESGLLDEAYVFQAPGFLGGRDAKTSLEGAGWTSPRGIPRLSGLTASPVGQDMLLHGYLGRSS